jgi:hypothetical protein
MMHITWQASTLAAFSKEARRAGPQGRTMIMHYYIDESRKQKLKHHCLVDYDPASERAVYSLKIPKSEIDLLRHFVRFEQDDP